MKAFVTLREKTETFLLINLKMDPECSGQLSRVVCRYAGSRGRVARVTQISFVRGVSNSPLATNVTMCCQLMVAPVNLNWILKRRMRGRRRGRAIFTGTPKLLMASIPIQPFFHPRLLKKLSKKKKKKLIK